MIQILHRGELNQDIGLPFRQLIARKEPLIGMTAFIMI